MTILVRCSCSWEIPDGNVAGVPIAVVLAPHVVEMIRHWRDGHQLSCRAELRHVVRQCLRRYRQLTRGRDVDRDAVAHEARRRGMRVETYNPFTDEWSDW